jgi:hypothetical protein
MSDICFLARFAYDNGQDPIDYAAHSVIGSHISAHFTILAARMENPAAFPGYVLDLTTAALSRRILGDLMDAGWTPPEVTP